jgi:hypothetical protein
LHNLSRQSMMCIVFHVGWWKFLFVDFGNLAPSENIKAQQILKDISNSVLESKAKATKGVRKSSASDG